MISNLEILKHILDYSEWWMVLLALVVWRRNKLQPGYMKPIRIYLLLAFIYNFYCDALIFFYPYLPERFHTNTFVYNLHSLTRFICFTVFFFRSQPNQFVLLKQSLITLFGIIFIFYFFFIDNFFNPNYISGDLMTGESFFLIIFCLLHYLSILQAENARFRTRKDFWIVTGLGFYEVLTFFMFLFYKPLIESNSDEAEALWYFHNLAYIVFISFIIKSLYVPAADNH